MIYEITSPIFRSIQFPFIFGNGIDFYFSLNKSKLSLNNILSQYLVVAYVVLVCKKVKFSILQQLQVLFFPFFKYNIIGFHFQTSVVMVFKNNIKLPLAFKKYKKYFHLFSVKFRFYVFTKAVRLLDSLLIVQHVIPLKYIYLCNPVKYTKFVLSSEHVVNTQQFVTSKSQPILLINRLSPEFSRKLFMIQISCKNDPLKCIV